jgi:hypothetical protein
MSRRRAKGKLSFLRVHRERGYGPPADHIPVHVMIELKNDSPYQMGFPLEDDGDQLVHEAWVSMLRDAFTHGLTVEVLSDHETERGNHGVIRDLTLVT